MSNSGELRRLAAWYRDQAERAGSPVIWDRRLRTAEELEAMADDLEKNAASSAFLAIQHQQD